MKMRNMSIQEANRILVDEIQYFLRQNEEYREKNNSFFYFLREKLVELNKGLAKSISLRYSEKGIGLDELIHDAEIAMYLCSSRSDNEIAQFSTYATYYVRGALKKMFSKKAGYSRGFYLPNSVLEKKKLIESLTYELGNKYGRKPTDEEILDYYNDVKNKKRIGFFDLFEIKGNKRIKMVASNLTSKEKEKPVYSEDEKRALMYYLNNSILNSREKYIINSFFETNGHKFKKLKELGNELGLTRERVRQIKERAIKKLRKAMKKENYYRN